MSSTMPATGVLTVNRPLLSSGWLTDSLSLGLSQQRCIQVQVGTLITLCTLITTSRAMGLWLGPATSPSLMVARQVCFAFRVFQVLLINSVLAMLASKGCCRWQAGGSAASGSPSQGNAGSAGVPAPAPAQARSGSAASPTQALPATSGRPLLVCGTIALET